MLASRRTAFCAAAWAVALLSLPSLPSVVSAAPSFSFPTANRFLFSPGNEEKFFVGTVGKPWTSGTFGCVRSEGWQFHEGLDIRCLERDRQGEPVDPVVATADGTVAYINRRTSLSTYGNYIILRHMVEGLEIYSVYAHLRAVRPDLKTGQAVKSGEAIGTLGRTANTRQGISKDRAHVHFELTLRLTDQYSRWHKKNQPKQRNDHGDWNGQSLIGIDPQAVLLAQQRQGANFSLLAFLRDQPELCRVLVRVRDMDWNRRYPGLVTAPSRAAAAEGIAGYELALNYAGVPFQIVPRAASEMKGRSRFQLLSVNAAEYARNPCRRLVVRRGSQWVLGRAGTQLLELLAF